jgi:hypothetical protein
LITFNAKADFLEASFLEDLLGHCAVFNVPTKAVETCAAHDCTINTTHITILAATKFKIQLEKKGILICIIKKK